jgi:hypothetical protein
MGKRSGVVQHNKVVDTFTGAGKTILVGKEIIDLRVRTNGEGQNVLIGKPGQVDSLVVKRCNPLAYSKVHLPFPQP